MPVLSRNLQKLPSVSDPLPFKVIVLQKKSPERWEGQRTEVGTPEEARGGRRECLHPRNTVRFAP